MAFDSRVVLHDITFAVQEGEFVSVLGPSGCGKTTILNLVAGFLTPSNGCILLDGRAIEAPGPDRSMVFQDDAVFPWYSVRENVGYGLRFKDLGRSERIRIADHFIGLVGLSGWEDSYPYQLSGGMRKRVDVARAFASGPAVLLMDEPFAAVDVITKEYLQSEFLRLLDSEKMTVLFVTHDIEEALFLSDRVLLLASDPGRLVYELDVPFSRPRPELLRMNNKFQQLRRELRVAIDSLSVKR